MATRQEVANVYWAGRKAYTLANDLFALTGDRKYQRPWALKAQLGKHAVTETAAHGQTLGEAAEGRATGSVRHESN